MSTNHLRLIALCLGSASSILAQSSTFRPTPTNVTLDFASNIDHIITLRLVVLGDPAGTGSVADLSTHATVKGQEIAISLTDPQVQAIRAETLQGRAVTILGQACGKPIKPGDACSADDRTDINVTLPDGFIVSEASSVKAREVVLTVATLAPECREGATSASNWPGTWTVSPGTFESASYDGNSTPSRIKIVFRAQPENGGKVSIHYKPSQTSVVCTLDVSAANLAPPVASKDDPTGGADLFLALGYTRSASSTSTTDVLNTDVFFRYPFHRFAAFGAVGHITPTFTLKAATKPQDDENSMILTAPAVLQRPVHPSNWFIQAFQLSAGPAFETDKKVRSKDILGDVKATLYPSDWPIGEKMYVRASGYIGTELGKNITHENAAVSGGSIQRFKLGAAARWVYEVDESKGREISISGSYDWRKLFRPESREDDDTLTLPAGTFISGTGDSTQIPAGTLTYRNVFTTSEGKRRYLTVLASYSLTRNILASLEYDRGSLPPVFKRVDKLQIGITLMFNAFGSH